MRNVLNTTSDEEFRKLVFQNFLEAARKLDVIGDVSVDYEGGTSIAPTAPGGSTFDTIYLKDANTYITRNEAGDMVFHDVNAGDITLTQIATLISILWTSGSAYGVKFANAAGTEKLIGLMEDADGITYFNDTSEVE
jgi:hypothetical protein